MGRFVSYSGFSGIDTKVMIILCDTKLIVYSPVTQGESRMRSPEAPVSHGLLLPLRDLLSLGLWGVSFITRRVQWGDSLLDVARDGSARLVETV